MKISTSFWNTDNRKFAIHMKTTMQEMTLALQGELMVIFINKLVSLICSSVI